MVIERVLRAHIIRKILYTQLRSTYNLSGPDPLDNDMVKLRESAATRGKVCDVRYIKADEVEEWVWWQVKSFAEHPLAWIKLFLETDSDGDSVWPLLDKQIKKLRQRVSVVR